MTTDLQHVLDDDWNLLQQQIEIIRLEQLQQSLKAICERIDKEPLADRVLSTTFFTGSNAACGEYSRIDRFFDERYCLSDAELVKPLVEPTTRLLKAYESRILSIDIDHLLQEVGRSTNVDLHRENLF